jgi:phosphoadenosine phosphosulfate reductase
MDQLPQIEDATAGLSATEMLRELLTTWFPGEVAVTASLRAPSIVVLKIISSIDPTTPVIFCHPRQVFPESQEYRAQIVDLLGLTNIKVVTRSDPVTRKRPFERCERLWSESPDGMGRSKETIHLNDTLAPYRCWIKAAYHERTVGSTEQRFYRYGGKLIVDALRGRSKALIDRFMQAHQLPYHPKVSRRKQRVEVAQSDAPDIGWHF